MKRHGYRIWHRLICRFTGHKPWYSARRTDWMGMVEAYILSCQRCGEVLDSFHPEAFERRP